VGARCDLKKFKKHPKNISAPIGPIQEVQDVVPPDVEELAPHRPIRARCATENFILLTTE
jgi:hypothetical protein